MSEKNKEDEDKPKGFWGAFQQGYDEEDKKIREDTAPLLDKVAGGAIEGMVETVAGPFRWFRSLFK